MLFAGVLGLAGCGASGGRPDPAFVPSDTITSTVGRDSALAVLTSMRRTAFDSAFSVLDRYHVTRTVRTEQLSPSGVVTAVRSYTLRYGPAPERGVLRRRDSAGTFRRGGLFGRVAPARNPADRPADLTGQVLPDEPAYVEPRTREAFRYALRADTLLNGAPVYVLEARARARGTGQDQGVRYVRLLIDRGSRQLIGLTTVRADAVLLFRENSRFFIRLRRAPDGASWVPHVTRTRASVQVPFRRPRQFRTVSAFYHYRP
ncbi:MAG: hypothetical protein ABEL97_01160 [Salinibacter sp.]